MTEISGDGPLAGPDDSESGDVEEGYGSGETKGKYFTEHH